MGDLKKDSARKHPAKLHPHLKPCIWWNQISVALQQNKYPSPIKATSPLKKEKNHMVALKVLPLNKMPGGGAVGSGFAGCVLLASQNPHPILVYSVANYRPHLNHFWASIIVISRTKFNASRLLNIKTTAGAISQPWIFLFLNLCLPKFSYPKNPENLRPHSSNSTKNVTPL